MALAYAPCRVSTHIAGIPVHIEVQTDYPFEESVRITVSSVQPVRFPLSLRIPAWATEARVAIDDGGWEQVEAGTLYTIERQWSIPGSIYLRLSMPIKVQTRYSNSVSVERGPLVYSLQINEQWRQIRGEIPHADWEVYPDSPWNYALEIDRSHPEQSCSITVHPVANEPFSPEGAPVHMKVKGRRVPGWAIEHGAAGSLPESPVVTDTPEEELTLIPYGCTNLRITEFPTVG